ncbi:MAG: aminotransferase class I/II-fold pyridoxal phosphate-dependent enzyme, partial [Planctomycetota bacterium]|nr:aminotransferase class I/II-fold pyridoxal phosphate-dependent enzyme [Planctomycetota bacterium]
EFGVYMVRNGRINVAGVTSDNVERLCESIAAVV